MCVLEHDRENEWDQEAAHVESDYQVQELFSLHELEVDQLLDGLQFVEMQLIRVLLVKDTSQVLVIEINIFESFLVSSDLLSNDQFLEIDQTVLNLVCLLLHVYFLLVLQ